MNKSNTLKFAVCDSEGFRSTCWLLTINEKKGDRQIYLTSEVMSKMTKMTLHASGQLKVSFIGKPGDSFTGKNLPSSRDTLVTEVESLFEKSLTAISRIFIVNSALKPDLNEKSEDIIWLESDRSTFGIEILVLISNVFIGDTWPFKEEGSTPIANYEFDDGTGLYVVCSASNFKIELPEKMNFVPFKNFNVENFTMANTIITWGVGVNKEISFVECDVEVY